MNFPCPLVITITSQIEVPDMFLAPSFSTAAGRCDGGLGVLFGLLKCSWVRIPLNLQALSFGKMGPHLCLLHFGKL